MKKHIIVENCIMLILELALVQSRTVIARLWSFKTIWAINIALLPL